MRGFSCASQVPVITFFLLAALARLTRVPHSMNILSPARRSKWHTRRSSPPAAYAGEMAERLKAPVSKTGLCASAAWVRIPLSPLELTSADIAIRRAPWRVGFGANCRRPGQSGIRPGASMRAIDYRHATNGSALLQPAQAPGRSPWIHCDPASGVGYQFFPMCAITREKWPCACAPNQRQPNRPTVCS